MSMDTFFTRAFLIYTQCSWFSVPFCSFKTFSWKQRSREGHVLYHAIQYNKLFNVRSIQWRFKSSRKNIFIYAKLLFSISAVHCKTHIIICFERMLLSMCLFLSNKRSVWNTYLFKYQIVGWSFLIKPSSERLHCNWEVTQPFHAIRRIQTPGNHSATCVLRVQTISFINKTIPGKHGCSSDTSPECV